MNQLRKIIRNRQWAWRELFLRNDGSKNEAAKIALSNLSMFCNATASSFHSDPYQMARMAGRLEVFQEIMNYLHINDYDQYLNLEGEESDD